MKKGSQVEMSQKTDFLSSPKEVEPINLIYHFDIFECPCSWEDMCHTMRPLLPVFKP